MTIEIVKGKNYPYCFINGLEKVNPNIRSSIEKILYSSMSYFVKNFQRTYKYKRGEWDGRDVLMYKSRSGSIYFPVGLINEAVSIITAHGINVTIKSAPKKKKINTKFVWKSDKKLYDFQEKALNAFISEGDKYSINVNSGIICMPTGSGKTIVLCKIIEYYSQPTLIVVHTKELLHQWVNVIGEVFGIEASVIGDGTVKYNSDIAVATMQTLNSLIKKRKIDLSGFSTLVIDEAHRAPAETIYSISMRCDANVRVGATATPHREDGADLKMYAALGPIVININAIDLIKSGVIAKPEFRFLRPPIVPIRGREWSDVRDIGIVANDERNDMIVEEVKKLVKDGHSVYISVDIIDHGEILIERLKSVGLRAEWLHGRHSSKLRKRVIEEFRRGELSIIVSTLLKEGVDIPEITAYVNAGGGKSEVSTIQKVGRALRKSEKKGLSAVIVDFIDGGHVFLTRHWDARWFAYREYYGHYCPFPGD